jgi:Protein of unknown function (DUF559)/Transcriptional regulator, AbiEi antitoxin
MSELSRLASTPRTRNAAIEVPKLAARYWGVISRGHLVGAGLSNAGIARWIADGRLHRVFPGVYAVGQPVLSTEGELAAALLYAGSGAALSHETAAWWWQLVERRPTQLAISAPGRRRSLERLRIHHPRNLERVWHRRLPVTPPARTLLDFAACVSRRELRRALAEAFYLRLVTAEAINAVPTRGHPGSGALRAALAAHTPQLPRTRKGLEERFLELCEHHGISVPEMNVWIEGMRVDALWREHRLIVELDSQLAHGQETRVEQDRRRELKLRSAGWTVLRYSWQLVTQEGDRVAADLRAALAGR